MDPIPNPQSFSQNSVGQNQNPIQNPAPPIPIPANLPFFKRKVIIIPIILIVILFIALISLLIFSSLRGKKKSTQIEPKPLPSPILQKEKPIPTSSWEMELVYDPSDSIYTIQQLSLQKEEYKETNSNSSSPYTLYILDKNANILTSMKVSISTRLVLPEIFKNSSSSAGLESAPLTTILHIPHYENGKSIQIKNSDIIIAEVEFPDALNSLIQNKENTLGVTDSRPMIVKTENVSPNGWRLSANPICENGKAYAQYSHDIPEYAGVIFTYEQTNPIESLEYLDDSSWQKPVGSVILLTGNGSYTAKGNLINWNPSMGQLIFNGSVGLRKNKAYKGVLMLSGDWTCGGDADRGGCVPGDGPTPDYIEQAKVTVTFNTIDCPTPTSVPSPTSVTKPIPQTQCKPDPKCVTGKKTVQMCPLVCN